MPEAVLTIKKSLPDDRDWNARDIYSKLGSSPAVLDYRGDLLPVRDQGKQGSCAAMSSACMKEWQEKIDVNSWAYMSPQFIYNHRSTTGEGMQTRDLMKVLNKHGVCLEKKYPYGSFGDISEELKEEALKNRISGYALVDDVESLKRSLILNGPCLMAVPVYNYGTRMWFKKDGDSFLGGHAMAVVGYNKEGFVLRNSWGVGWGEGGYCLFPYSDWADKWEVWSTIDDKSKHPLPKLTLLGRLIALLKDIFGDWPSVD